MQQRNELITNIYIKSRLIAALFVSICMLLCGCGTTEDRQEIVLEGEQEWRTGDLLFRSGYGVESRAVAIQGMSTYSHIAILWRDSGEGRWLLIHAVPGEGEPEFIKMEPIAQYYHPMRAQKGAWMRVNCSDSIAQAAARYAKEKYEQQVLFDNDYQLSDTSQLYCTELVWRAYMRQGIDVTNGRRHPVPEFFCKDKECIFPNDIEKSETTLFVKPFKQKKL